MIPGRRQSGHLESRWKGFGHRLGWPLATIFVAGGKTDARESQRMDARRTGPCLSLEMFPRPKLVHGESELERQRGRPAMRRIVSDGPFPF